MVSPPSRISGVLISSVLLRLHLQLFQQQAFSCSGETRVSDRVVGTSDGQTGTMLSPLVPAVTVPLQSHECIHSHSNILGNTIDCESEMRCRTEFESGRGSRSKCIRDVFKFTVTGLTAKNIRTVTFQMLMVECH